MAKRKKREKPEPLDPVAQVSATRIWQARKARNWTQEQLAEQTGWNKHKPAQAQPHALSPSRIGNFEQGTRRVGLEEAQILTAAFGDFPAPYYMGVISEQEAAVLGALRRPTPTQERPTPPTDRPSATP